MGAPGGGDGHAVAVGAPRRDRLAGPQLGPTAPGEPEGGLDASLRPEHARPRLEQAHGVVGRSEAGEPPADLGRREHLVLETVFERAPPRTGEKHAALRSGHDTAGLPQEPAARLLLELRPALVGPAQQGHVAGMLEVGFADDPAAAVGRAHRVGRREAVEPEDAPSAARELPHRRASHRAEADDDDVRRGHDAAQGRFRMMASTVSWARASWKRFRTSSTLGWLCVMPSRVALSSSNTSQGVAAVSVAVRGLPVRMEISPKNEPSASSCTLTDSPRAFFTNAFTVPVVRMNRLAPAAPSVTRMSPGSKVSSFKPRITATSSSSVKPSNSGVETTGAAALACASER